ncbi:hypothetical protein [Zobellella iuensis]|uniref:Secreted protein n=1 Tax=Zobellella iuensis TaxID=2803811 RepID=A0ABS1QV12_9GAMM|nr:hypothetical protein [Zobellella iuensis]MBL1378059.1 hypothetical protein [Zobellella iuensis]
MKKVIPAALLATLFALSGCDEPGPTADVGDKIDEVMQQAASQPEAYQDEAADLATEPKPEMLEQQKEEFQQAIEEASREAEDRLNEIMDRTLNQE